MHRSSPYSALRELHCNRPVTQDRSNQRLYSRRRSSNYYSNEPKKKKDADASTTLSGTNTSLLIEYFENGKPNGGSPTVVRAFGSK